MKELIKKLTKLSAFHYTDEDIASATEDFSDILPLINTISEFETEICETALCEDFSELREDTPKTSDFKLIPKSIPKVIS